MSGPSRSGPPAAAASSGLGTAQGIYDVTASAYSVNPLDATTDWSANIQGALTDAGNAGGGRVQLPRTPTSGWLTAVGLVVPPNVALEGFGRRATLLRAPANASAVPIVKTADLATFARIAHLGVDGNKSNGSSADGIEVSSSTAFIGDSQVVIHDVYARNARDGIRLAGGTNLRMPFLDLFYIHLCTRYGLYVSTTDAHVTNGAIGGNNNHGVYVQSGGDSIFQTVRSFYAGYNGTIFNVDASGWRIDPGVQRVSMYGCRGQDNGLYALDCAGDENMIYGFDSGADNQRANATAGFIRVAGSRNTIRAHRRSADLSGTGPHVVFDGATATDNHVEVDGNDDIASGNRVSAINGAQLSGQSFLFRGGHVATSFPNRSGTGNTTSGSNQITNAVPAVGTFTVGHVITGAGIPAGSTITAISGSASPYTLTISANATATATSIAFTTGSIALTLQQSKFVLTMLGNLTISHGAFAAWKGAICKITLIQDATGGRTVTWPANVKALGGAVGTAPTVSATANVSTAIELTYDGTNWIQTG